MCVCVYVILCVYVSVCMCVCVYVCVCTCASLRRIIAAHTREKVVYTTELAEQLVRSQGYANPTEEDVR